MLLPRLTLLAGLAVAACSAIVPSTAARLAAVDPLTADPGALELVVILPPGLAVSPGSARLKLAAMRGAERVDGTFKLEDRVAPADLSQPEGATARGFGLGRQEAERMRALQAEVAGWSREGAARGSLGMGLGGCAIGAGPAPDATGSVLIRVREDGPFLPLVAEGRLADLLGPEVLAAIKPCQAAE